MQQVITAFVMAATLEVAINKEFLNTDWRLSENEVYYARIKYLNQLPTEVREYSSTLDLVLGLRSY